MPSTRTSNSADNDIKDLIRDAINSALAPMAKSSQIDDLMNMIAKQSEKIAALEESVNSKDEKIALLEDDLAKVKADLAQVKASVDLVARKNENLEQYTRRSSVRIYGIPPGQSSDSEHKEDVMAIVENCHKETGIAFNRRNIDRAHRVGEVYEHPVTKVKSQAIIVKFRSWDSRAEFYHKRPKFSTQPGTRRPFSVAVDLTRERYTLLQTAREKVENYPDIKFVYTDINCRLALRTASDHVKFFSSVAELDKILSAMKFVPKVM